MKGHLARCSKGALGLITVDEKVLVKYQDGTEGMSWIGIHLTDKVAPAGTTWMSRNPTIYVKFKGDLVPRKKSLWRRVMEKQWPEWTWKTLATVLILMCFVPVTLITMVVVAIIQLYKAGEITEDELRKIWSTKKSKK